ncbi:MAG: hypothetical protein ABEJ72_02155, partial [Candidatus Aenigmatarchaeota archaeon]
MDADSKRGQELLTPAHVLKNQEGDISDSNPVQNAPNTISEEDLNLVESSKHVSFQNGRLQASFYIRNYEEVPVNVSVELGYEWVTARLGLKPESTVKVSLTGSATESTLGWDNGDVLGPDLPSSYKNRRITIEEASNINNQIYFDVLRKEVKVVGDDGVSVPKGLETVPPLEFQGNPLSPYTWNKRLLRKYLGITLPNTVYIRAVSEAEVNFDIRVKLTGEGHDTDGDGSVDYRDNCRYIKNPEQKDRDNDGSGNPCDPKNNNQNQQQTGETNTNNNQTQNQQTGESDSGNQISWLENEAPGMLPGTFRYTSPWPFQVENVSEPVGGVEEVIVESGKLIRGGTGKIIAESVKTGDKLWEKDLLKLNSNIVMEKAGNSVIVAGQSGNNGGDWIAEKFRISDGT